MTDSTTLLPPDAFFRLSSTFNYTEYIECEQELWALFPECTGKRVNFIQAGLSAFLYAEVSNDGTMLANDETYVLMPHSDNCLRAIRMRCVRRLSLGEYRLSLYTALRTSAQMQEEAFQQVASAIVGEELLAHVHSVGQ